MLFKLIGILLILFGLFMLIIFPGGAYQRSNMLSTGIYLGFGSLIIGILLLVFG
ncbi:MAG: hypothetical protein KJ697_03075 [Nanoarchaeota archaeon]|nr:hypothetical protein [Nanoarchaeota archaeon]